MPPSPHTILATGRGRRHAETPPTPRSLLPWLHREGLEHWAVSRKGAQKMARVGFKELGGRRKPVPPGHNGAEWQDPEPAHRDLKCRPQFGRHSMPQAPLGAAGQHFEVPSKTGRARTSKLVKLCLEPCEANSGRSLGDTHCRSPQAGPSPAWPAQDLVRRVAWWPVAPVFVQSEGLRGRLGPIAGRPPPRSSGQVVRRRSGRDPQMKNEVGCRRKSESRSWRCSQKWRHDSNRV